MGTSIRKSDNVVFLGQAGQQQGIESEENIAQSGVTGLPVNQCRSTVGDALPKMLDGLFDALDDKLYQLAENSTNNSLQTSYFDALRSLRVFRPQCEKNYVANLLANFDGFWRTAGNNPLMNSPEEGSPGAELSLVGEDELEEDLATSSIISKAATRYHSTLSMLNQRFGVLLGGRRVGDKQNPLGPSVVTTLFRQELASWDGDILVRIVVYKAFERHVVSQLQPVYDELNQQLADAGILPDLQQGQGGSEQRPAAPNPAQQASAAPIQQDIQAQPLQQPGVAVPSIADLWVHMQKMMDEQQRRDLGMFSNHLSQSAQLPEMPRSVVFDKLSALQQQVMTSPVAHHSDIQASQQQLLEQLVNRLGASQEEHSGHALGKHDQQTIDVILMLFNQVLDDPNLSDAMRAMLARLQIPVLKAAIADATFIEDKAHPARKLLNTLAQASIGWTESSDRASDSLYGKVKEAVDRILHEFHDDVSLFTEVSDEFADYMEQSTRVAAAVEKRVAQALEGEDRLQASREKVDSLLQSYPWDDLPEVAQQLLNDPWRKLLSITFLRKGVESQEWKTAVSVADELVNSVLRGDKGVGREELLGLIPGLATKLRAGFTSISFNAADGRKMLNQLQACHIEVIRSKKLVTKELPPEKPEVLPTAELPDVAPAVVSVAPVEADEIKPSAPAANKPAQASTEVVAAVVADKPADVVSPKTRQLPKRVLPQRDESDHHDDAVASIREGQWVKMHYRNKDIVGKLVWSSKYTGTMLFVDSQGRKVAQINKMELTALFRMGEGSCLEEPEKPIMDRALDKMRKALHVGTNG